MTQLPTPEFSTLSLHDALPISAVVLNCPMMYVPAPAAAADLARTSEPSLTAKLPVSELAAAPEKTRTPALRSEEHTSELQSRRDLVCRLLLEKKKNIYILYVIY